MFSPDQFTHILLPSIWCMTTPRYYFLRTTFYHQKSYGKNSAKGTSELRSTRPNFIPFLATRCLYQGVHLTKGQPDPKAHQMSSWHDVVLLLATRCLYQEVCLTEYQSDPKAHQMSSWPDPKADQMSSWPDVLPLLLTRCLYWGVHLTADQPEPKADQMSTWYYLLPLFLTRCLYLGGWIQWHKFQVSIISSSWKIKMSGKNFTFCWFWLGKMHQNGLSGTYLEFQVCQIQWHGFQVSTISSSWKIKILGDK